MTLKRTVLIVAALWISIITVLHLTLNLNVKLFGSHGRQAVEDRFRIGFLPVT